MRTVCGIVLITLALGASAAELSDVRLWASPDKTRVVLDLSAAVDRKVFSLDNPDRVVIDLPAAKRRDMSPRAGKGLVSNLRFGRRGDGTRVVLDLEGPGRMNSFLLEPSGHYGHRLVVDLYPEGAAQPATVTPKPRPPSLIKTEERRIVVAIDPGHGGEDPGASGARGTLEKDVALQIARRVADLLRRQTDIEPVLTRKGDYYVRLRDRIAIAKQANADLFISIHADAFDDRRARGASVYALSPKGASSENARLLADRENRADLIGGIELPQTDDQLASVLVDFLMTASVEASLDVGKRLLQEMHGVGKLHKDTVQRAGFLVLKSPDIPSVLVETAFISNREEERRLRDPGYQRKLAQALVDGIRGYFKDYRPQRVVAELPDAHIIRNGETLSEIALAYGTSVEELKAANALADDQVLVGQRLQVPQ